MEITKVLIAILKVYSWLIVVRVIMTWVNPNPRNEILLWVVKLTEPLLGFLRPIIPLKGIDLSPIMAWLLIEGLMRVIVQVGM